MIARAHLKASHFDKRRSQNKLNLGDHSNLQTPNARRVAHGQVRSVTDERK